MKIIDAHAHLGYDPVFDVDFTEKELLEPGAERDRRDARAAADGARS